ncbi:MAG: hypothetical protein DDT32_01647 [Syntrophomonadaceae bacterium]|nr:hypothetical protein [Bacillota bacterium]
MVIDKEFLSKYNIVSYKFKEKFYSKKNQVSLKKFSDTEGREYEWVVKHYSNPQMRLKNEVKILMILHSKGLSVPKIIYNSENYVVMEYIQGRTLLGYIEEKEQLSLDNHVQSEVLGVIEELAHWLKKFYIICTSVYNKTYILGDVNLRNFIVGDQIYGVDFENTRMGKVEEDIGKLCAFALTYNPPFTPWRCTLVDFMKKIMSDVIEMPIDRITMEMANELDEIAKRRNIRYNSICRE